MNSSGNGSLHYSSKSVPTAQPKPENLPTHATNIYVRFVTWELIDDMYDDQILKFTIILQNGISGDDTALEYLWAEIGVD